MRYESDRLLPLDYKYLNAFIEKMFIIGILGFR